MWIMNNTTSENSSYAIRKPPDILDQWNGYPEIFSFSQALAVSRQYLLLRTVILLKKSRWVPPIHGSDTFFYFVASFAVTRKK